ncbi:MAG: aminotransferase class V-fold PLP-dependent enzyme [Burkholderiaceae bacterium]
MEEQPRSLLKARTILAQALGAGDPITGALIPPVHMSSTFLRDPDNGYSAGFVYGRTDNATVRQVERVLATLEGAADTMMFSSGMAAATAVFLALEKPTHIIASHVIYWGFREWLDNVGMYGGHVVSFVDTSDLDAVAAAIRPGETGIFWIETPSNPLWTITDIAAIAEIAHAAGALLCVDSTVSTPIITRPIAFGADLVVHSATKYLNGHSDVIAGAIAVAADSPHWQGIQKVRGQLGAIVGPFEAWLLLRGMRTLDVRLREQSKSAAKLAGMLVGHAAVSNVLYPGLATHPGHATAERQMGGLYGGMLSIRMRGGEAAAIAAASRVRVWKRATSFGGVESLIEHRASIEGEGTPCPHDLLRLSTGLEDIDDLFEDLMQALG